MEVITEQETINIIELDQLVQEQLKPLAATGRVAFTLIYQKQAGEFCFITNLNDGWSDVFLKDAMKKAGLLRGKKKANIRAN